LNNQQVKGVMITLKGKSIFITGASSGIGKECAVKAAQLGARVVLVARDRERLKKTLDSLVGDNHLSFSCDVTVSDHLEDVVTQAAEKMGKISGFIHSAGIEATIPLRNMNRAKFEEMFSVNVLAAFEISRLLSNKKYLDPAGSSFIFIGSVMGLLGEPGKVAYSSSKAALIGGTKSMAIELAPKKIRVNCVMPGVVETEMSAKLFQSIPEHSKQEIVKKHPLGLGQPGDIAHLCMFLISDAARWLTGSTIPIDGGYSAH
jgi:NAD(P)-dependent dehydrogenase (short-subunit alcohol dehydrogenase family)